MTKFHDRHDKAMAFIKAEIAAGRPFPEATAIAENIGYQCPSSAGRELLIDLCGLGRLRLVGRVPGKRGYRYKYEIVED